MFNSLTLLEKSVFGALTAAGIGVGYLLFSAPEAGEDWEAFKAEHHCVSVGKATGNNRSGYQCDDGKIHYRWRQQR